MAIFASTGFAGTPNALLETAIPQFSRWFIGGEAALLDGADGRSGLYTNNFLCTYIHSAVPSTPNYLVRALIYRLTGNTGSATIGLIARASTSETTGYVFQWNIATATLSLTKYRAGFTAESLGTQTGVSLAAAASGVMSLEVEDVAGVTTLRPIFNGALWGPGVRTDTGHAGGNGPITAAGRSGLLVNELREFGVANVAGMDDWWADTLEAGGAAASGVTLTAAASLIAGTASGAAGTLAFQAAGLEFGRRTGLAINTFALDASVNYRYTVHANALVLGAPIFTSDVIATDSTGRLPNATNAAFVTGQTVWVCAVRQADGQRCIFPMVVS